MRASTTLTSARISTHYIFRNDRRVEESLSQFWKDEFRFAPLVVLVVLTYSAAVGKGKVALIVALSLSSAGNAWGQASDNLPDYVPLLPAVKAKALAVDPQKGYLVKELKPGIFMITDGVRQQNCFAVFSSTRSSVRCLQLHQRKKSVNFGFVGEKLRQHASETQRLFRKCSPHPLLS